MTNLITRFVKEDAGQDLIEYALVGGLVALAAVATMGLVGDQLDRIYDQIKTKLATITIT